MTVLADGLAAGSRAMQEEIRVCMWLGQWWGLHSRLGSDYTSRNAPDQLLKGPVRQSYWELLLSSPYDSTLQ